ncbi:MAG TPA: S8 family serine peptidase, partial [Solirubrobacteraceae bacterium]
ALGNEHTDLGNPTIDETSPDYPPGTERARQVDNSCLDMPTEGRGVIAVAALGPSERKAYYSNYGVEQTDVSAPGGDRREGFNTDRYNAADNRILAPMPEGVAQAALADDPSNPLIVQDCTGGTCAHYQWLQGTSMASPHAAGVAALIVAQFGKRDHDHGGVTLAPSKVQEILERTAARRACPDTNPFTYPDPDLTPDYTARCEGDAGFNGFYGHGIVDALRAVTG